MEEKRIHAIADLTERRIKILQSIAGEKRRTQIISTDDEVGGRMLLHRMMIKNNR